MEYTPEQKQQFLDLAVARGYLEESTVAEWSFLALGEFIHNDYISPEQFQEIAAEVGIEGVFTEQQQQKKEEDEQPPEQDQDTVQDSPEQPQLRKPPPQLAKYPGSGTGRSAFKTHKTAVSPPATTPPPVAVARINADQETWKKEVLEDVESRIHNHQRLSQKIRTRSDLEIKRFRQGFILINGILLPILTVVSLAGFWHFLLSFAIGCGAGALLDRLRGSWSYPIYVGAFFINLVIGEILGSGMTGRIIQRGDIISFLLTACAGIIYLALCAAFSRYVESVYSDHF